MEFIDITQELFSCRIYPGDQRPVFERVKQMPEDSHQLTNFSMGAHNGTHIDAPLHFMEGGQAIEEMALDIFFGQCLVIDCQKANASEIIEACHHAERLLLKGAFAIEPAIARAIAQPPEGQQRLRLLGVESQSVSPEGATVEVHRLLLSAGVALLEGLDLSQAQPGSYTLAAFPLKLGGCEGAPARAVLIV